MDVICWCRFHVQPWACCTPWRARCWRGGCGQEPWTCCLPLPSSASCSFWCPCIHSFTPRSPSHDYPSLHACTDVHGPSRHRPLLAYIIMLTWSLCSWTSCPSCSRPEPHTVAVLCLPDAYVSSALCYGFEHENQTLARFVLPQPLYWCVYTMLMPLKVYFSTSSASRQALVYLLVRKLWCGNVVRLCWSAVACLAAAQHGPAAQDMQEHEHCSCAGR